MFGIDIIDAALVPAMLVALTAGLLSFLSPCVLPIVPPYLAYMGGITMHDMTTTGGTASRKAVVPAVFFVLGLSTVFLFLGFTASVVGRMFLTYQEYFSLGAGVVIYLFGLHFVGLNRALWVFAIVALLLVLLLVPGAILGAGEGGGVGAALAAAFAPYWLPLAVMLAVSVFAWALPYDQFPFLMYEARIDAGDRGGTAFGAYVLGLAFAFGWTPCIGPILGAILSLAAAESSLARGTILLGFYAAGLGIPFLLSAIYIHRAMGVMNRLKPHMRKIERAMGALLTLVGVALLTGAFTAFSWWLLETFPALGMIG